MAAYVSKYVSVLCFINSILLVTVQECGPPIDCVVSEWNHWTGCSHSCGEYGSRTRTRVVFQKAECGGTCPFDIEETENCNRKCCPVDCTYTKWSSWDSCSCTEDGCDGEGERFKCTRKRRKLTDSACGGYCDEQTTNIQCGYLCCYRDCIPGWWTDWSKCDAPCGQIGTKNRTRGVIQDAACGGKPCQNMKETVTCMGKCCPVHCVLGDWSEWSSCESTCGEALQVRTRHVQLPVCGGEPCTEEPVEQETRTCTNYFNVDCELSPWAAWSDCYLDNGFCGDGTKSRTRSVIIPPSCHGQQCGNFSETRPCSGPCCRRDCKVTEWSDWGYCSSKCGQGLSYRTRSIESWPSCGGTFCPTDLVQSRGCLVTEVMDCKLTEWSGWSSCSNSCGNGVSTRSREMISPAYCDGECPSNKTHEDKPCESYSAKSDCEVTEWSIWSECTRSCAGGLETRNRNVVVDAMCGGASCPNLTESRTCQEPCEQLCKDETCDCELGYQLNADNVTCSEISCFRPIVQYCPQTHRLFIDCKYPRFRCAKGYTLNQTCEAYCSDSEWKLTGSPTSITCMEDGSWSKSFIFCARPNALPLGITIDATEIFKYTPKDTCFAILSTKTTNVEKAEPHTYSITSDETGRFYIDENTVCLTRMADYNEKPDRWNVTFRSSDIEGKYVEQTFSFAILDANNPPASVQLQPNTIPENSPADTFVGCLTGTDYDSEQSLTFTLINSLRTQFTSFQENGKTCLKVIQKSDVRCATDGGTYCVLNMEEQFKHLVTVRATDNGTPPMSALFEVPVYLTDVNDRQTAVVIVPDKLPENVPPGQKLVKFVSVDEDVGQVYTYRIVSDTSSLFNVDGDYLVASRMFDYEKEPDLLLEIEVESTDDATPPLTIISFIKLKIQDVNEPPFHLQVSSVGGFYPFNTNTPRVPENIEGVLGTVTVKDQDFNDFIEIAFSTGNKDSGSLILSNTSCININDQMFCKATLSMLPAFDYETSKYQNVTLVATDMAGVKAFLNISLEVIDTNDPPTDVLVNGLKKLDIDVPENEMNYRVGDLSAVDDDEQDKHVFNLVQSANDMFLLEGNILKTSKTDKIDFERQESYNLVISVADDGEPRQTSYFDIVVNVVDVNESPTITMLSNNKISENSAEGTVVGELSTIDPDNLVAEKQTFTYSLSDDSHRRFQLNGNLLEVRKSTQRCGVQYCVLDFEKEKRVMVKVITLDDGKPVLQREDRFTLEIEDTNDAPTDITIDTNVIKENQPPGTYIGTISALDDDGNIITYAIQNNAEVFEIQNNKLYTLVELNYERLNNFGLMVLAKDNGVPEGKIQEMININVLDINEQPYVVNVSTSLSIREDANIGGVVATYAISDPDSSDDVAVSLLDNLDMLSIRSPVCKTTPLSGATDCTVDLILISLLDINKIQTFSISLIVSDKAGLAASEDIIVNVLDVNVRPTNILLDSLLTDEIHVKENTKGSVVALLSASDRDPEENHTFMIVSDKNTYFQIDGKLLKTLPAANIDYEAMSDNFTLTIEVVDSGEPPLSFRKTFTIIIEDVNEVPSALILSSYQIAENSLTGSVIGTIDVTDPDRNQSHNLRLVNDYQGRFILDGNVLKVGDGGSMCTLDDTFKCKLNHEDQSLYNLSVEVKDSGIPASVALFHVIINVTDVNEKSRNIKISENRIPINAPKETLIGTLYADDEDINQSHAFEVLEESQYVDVSSSGLVTVKDVQNLNEGDIISISVKVMDNGSPPLFTDDIIQLVTVGTNMIIVTLEAVGDTVQLANNSIQIKENTPLGDVFAHMIVTFPETDRDIETKLIFGTEIIEDGSTSCQNVDDKTICLHEIKLSNPVDYEELKWIDITFETNADGAKSIDSFRITIKDINEAPISITFGNGVVTVSENSQNQFIGTFSVSDPDMQDPHVFSITGNNNFVITNDGRLFTSADAEIDYESVQYMTISIVATDAGLLTFTNNFNITVLDVNEMPISLILDNNKIPEMSSSGTEVGSLIVSDPEFDQNHSFTLLSEIGSHLFEIVGSKLTIADKVLQCDIKDHSRCLLDFERQSEYNLTILVMDYGTPTLTATFIINVQVTDVNDVPRSVSISSNKVPEDADMGTIVAILNAIDDDIGQTITFAIGNNDYFSIKERQILLTNTLDYETTSGHNISIFVTDDGDQPSTATQEFVIQVINVNEPPFNMNMSSTGTSAEQFEIDTPVISENLPALTYIGQIVVLDPDKSDNLKIKSVTSDAVVRNVHCIPVSKGTRCTADIRSGRVFDFEEEGRVQISIIAIDNDGLYIQKDMDLEIKDSNDSPTNIYLNNTDTSELVVTENSRNIILAKLTVEDMEDVQRHSYTLSGDSSVLLISGDELWVTAAAVLDYEARKEIHFTIKVTDDGMPQGYFEKDISLKIIDVNEAPSGLYISDNIIPENADDGYEIGSFIVKDEDNIINNEQDFTFTLQTTASLFKIVNDKILVAASRFDYETKKLYEEVVTVTDSGEPNMSSSFTLSFEISDVNEPPAHLEFEGKSGVLESATIGDIVGTVSARDPDEDQTLTFTILGTTLLAVDFNHVVINGMLDYESLTEIAFTVTVTNSGIPHLMLEKNFTLSIIDVNEVPTDIIVYDNYFMQIHEGSLTTESIAKIEVHDPDEIERLEAEIVYGKEIFVLVPASLNCSKIHEAYLSGTVCVTSLFLRKMLDFETDPTIIDLSIDIRDKGRLSLQRTFTFTLMDENELPKDIILNYVTDVVPENTPGYVIGTLSTIDDDSDDSFQNYNDEFKYVVVSDWNTFTVSGDKLIAKSSLDYETQDFYTVSIRSQDTSNYPKFLIKDFTIVVGDINEDPSKIELLPTKIARKAVAGEIVAKIRITDPDNEGRPRFQNHTCDVTPADQFDIDNIAFVIKLKVPLSGDVDNVQLTVTCTDTGVPALSLKTAFDVSVVDNVNAPKDIQLIGDHGSVEIFVNENYADIVVGTLSVINALTNGIIQSEAAFTLSAASLEYVSIDAKSLLLIKDLEFESQPEIDIEVFCKGSETTGDSFELAHTFVIKVKDVNEPPLNVLINGKRTVVENSKAGTVIGNLTTEDSDDGQHYNYTLLGVNYGLSATDDDVEMLNAFSIVDEVLIVGSEYQYINYEKSNVISLLVRSVDSGEPPLSVTSIVRLLIEDDIDPPTDILLSDTVIPENSPVNTVLGTLSIVDEDKNSKHQCEILNLIDVPFKVLADYQLAVAIDILDYETQKTYNVKVYCGDTLKDGSSVGITKMFIVNVTNVNEAPTDILLSEQSIEEIKVKGQVITEISVVDLDSQIVFISIEEMEDADYFQIQDNFSVVANVVFDYETRVFYSIVIKAEDGEGEVTVKTFELEVININEAPSKIILDRLVAAESSEPGSTVGRFRTEDPDRNQEFMYTLDTLNGGFDIYNNVLVVGATGLDFETIPSYNISVISIDNGMPPKSIEQSFIIEILDANDPPDEIIIDRFVSVPENAELNTVITTFKVADQDTGQKHACNVIKGEYFISVATDGNEIQKVVVTSKLNYEDGDKVDVILACTDGEYEVRKDFTINITDVNEAPTSIKLTGSNTVYAEAPIGYVIGTVTVEDEDMDQTHLFTLSEADSDILEISANNELILKKFIPDESKDTMDPSITFTIYVADNGTPVLTYMQAFRLPITDVEVEYEGLPIIEISVIKLNFTSRKGDVLGQIYPTNMNVSSSIQFSLVKNPNDIFSIENNAVIVLATNTETIDETSFEIRIQVEDVETLEKETKSIKVSINKYKDCLLTENKCKENETCMEQETLNVCECIDDFKRNSEEICTKVDDCKLDKELIENQTSHKCLNGGTCIDSINSYNCNCTDSFEGIHCEKEKAGFDDCNVNPCLNNGSCVLETNASIYHCACNAGWTGMFCDVNVDDCVNATCFNGGTCIDEHLTFLCKCDGAWKGLRCEYDSVTCIEIDCNISHVCVGFSNSNKTLCRERDIYLIKLEFTTVTTFNIQVFQARMVSFILENADLSVQHVNSKRQKRETNLEELQLYVTDAVEIGGQYIIHFVMIDLDSEPLKKDDALTILSQICNDTGSGDDNGDLFCPTIIQAYTDINRKQIRSNTGSSAGAIIGIIFGVIFVLVLMLVIYWLWKKKKFNTVKPMNSVQSGKEVPDIGYASMPTQSRVLNNDEPNLATGEPASPLKVKTNLIQVAPAPGDMTHESVV